MTEAPGIIDPTFAAFAIAVVTVGFNAWLLVRVLGFMRTVEDSLRAIERNTSKAPPAE